MASTPNYPEHWQSYLDIMKATISRIIADDDLLSQTEKQPSTVAVHFPAHSASAAK
jgi:hypothetical protein